LLFILLAQVFLQPENSFGSRAALSSAALLVPSLSILEYLPKIYPNKSRLPRDQRCDSQGFHEGQIHHIR